MGPHKVLVIGRADMLTPQLASPEAANALLKLLEEPPADTTLILTTDVPGALLPTIRSRVQAVRIAPLPTQQVAAFLRDALGRSPNESRQLAARSEGAIGRALELGEAEGDDLREAAREIVRATLARRLEPGLSAAHRFRPFGARGGFLRTLSEARALMRDLLAAAAGAAPAAPETAALAGEAPCLDDIIAALEALEAARELAERNVNPQLIVANLGRLGPGAAVRTPEPNSR